MKKISNMHDTEFECYVSNGLKSLGYAFPETDEQMAVFEKRVDNRALPKELDSPDFVFKKKQKAYLLSTKNDVNKSAESNWAIAARDGKDIPSDILERMKKDKDYARSKKNGNK